MSRGRTAGSAALAAVASVLILVSILAVYARTQILNPENFADRAAASLADERVRGVVATELTVQVAERGNADLLAARPLVESVVDTVIGSAPFRELFREAALRAHLILFERDRRAVPFDLSDAVSVVRFGLQSVSPELAEEIPSEVDVAALALDRRDFARTTLTVADRTRFLAIVAPLLAILALLGSVLLAPDRRTGLLRAAVAVAAGGVLIVVAMLILRARILAGVIGSEELTDADARGAVAGILDAYLGSLVGWGTAIAFGGAVVAGAAATLDERRGADPFAWPRRMLTEVPESRRGRAAWSACVIAAGLLIALDPATALEIGGLLLGGYLVFVGSGVLLALLGAPREDAERAEAGRRRSLLIAGATAAVIVAGAAIALGIVTDDDDPNTLRVPAAGCNGSPDYCGLRLNEAVFAGTHNSFSAADSPGWYIANQRHDIAQQLDDGIRLLLLDPHWGVQTAEGAVLTDFEREGRSRNKVAKALPPETLAAAQRLAGGLGLGARSSGEAEAWLCHTTCEIGATRMSDALADVRSFLDENPGEVVVLFLEPYVPPDVIASELERAGLGRELAVLDRGAPLPTLGDLVRGGRRLVVFTEKDADGSIPWYMDGFSFIQDTPLGVTRPGDLSCERNRGDASSPILMLNHWADVFPPQRVANIAFQTRGELLGRAHECERKRGMPVGFIAVDHYDLGSLIDVVTDLNDEHAEAAAAAQGEGEPIGMEAGSSAP